MRSEDIKIYPKKDQPKSGYLHPNHLKGKGSDGKDYCIAPSCSIYDRKYLNV